MPSVLGSVDRAAFAVAFVLQLRRAGARVGLTGIESFTKALATCPPESTTSLYWVARVTLVHRQSDLETFDTVFSAVFADAVLSLDPNARRQPVSTPSTDENHSVGAPGSTGVDEHGHGLPWIARSAGIETSTADATSAVPERLPSSIEAVADTPFESLDPTNLALLDDWLLAALRHWPTRRSRKTVPHGAGERVALRLTLVRSRRTGFEPFELVRTRRINRPRRIVMLCDVSQSMQHHAAAYFHLMRAAAVSTGAEVFAFSTFLTRLTPYLAHASHEVAIEQATNKVTDRFGGTRIATNLRALLHSRQGEACRGAIVLIASDGWDDDPPHELAVAMARLRRRAHRIIWLNPRVSAPEFEPLVGAMASALPYCDDLLPADTIRALSDVVAAIVRPGSR